MTRGVGMAALLCLSLVGLAWLIAPGCGSKAARHNRTNLVLTADQLLKDCPWLSDTSKHWGQEADLAAGEIPDYSHLGCFPLGNGRVFTTSGLQYPFGTMANTFGPTYQKRQGSLGTQSVVLIVRGRPYDLPCQRTEWVMRAGTVHTRLSDASGVQLDIYDCVVPDSYAIVRVIAATNGSRHQLKGVALGVAYGVPALEARDGLVASDGGGRFVRGGFVASRTEVEDQVIGAPLPEAAREVGRSKLAVVGSTVVCPIGALPPGKSLVKIAYTIIAPSEEEARRETERLEQTGFGALKETYDWWLNWYSDALTIECPDDRINEFIPIQQHIVRVQQAEAGGYSPMYMYTTCWVRDSNGPIRFMTQSGKFDEVKRALDYYYACSAEAGEVPMNFPLDLAIKQPLPSVNWAKAPVERAEVSSFIILQHYWYWLQSGDMAPIKEHWAYLRRNLLGQRVDEQGRLPFHGDETYRFPGYQIFEQTQAEPTDWVSMDLMSADSAWEYIAAARAMAEWAKVLGKHEEAREYDALADKVRESLDRLYWMADRGYYAPAMSDFSGERYRYPFANISLRPRWLVAPIDAAASEERDRRIDDATLAALRWLWKDSGTVKTTPGCGYYVGMTPGLVVWALADLNHASTPDAIRGLLNAASPSGGYAEMNTPDDVPTDRYWGKNRIRPWEGSINAEALVFALTAFRANLPQGSAAIRPRLLSGWDAVSIRNLACGKGRLEMTLGGRGRRREIDGQWDGGEEVLLATVGLAPHNLKGRGQFDASDAEPAEMDFSRGPALRPSRDDFDYGEPSFAGKSRTVAVTWDAETFRQVRSRDASAAAIDTKIAFPPEYLAAALYGGGGQRRAERLILDVEKYPGHCKTAAFWTEGDGRKIIDRFVELGGKVEKAKNPREKPGDIFGE